jgi:hypothetical protein
MIVVSSLVATTLRARPRSSIVALSSLRPISSEITQRAALQGEIAAVEGLEDEARRPIAPAQAALITAEGAVLQRLQEEAAGDAQVARQEWNVELERVNAGYRARVAAADRGAARMQSAQRSLKGA